MAKKVLIIDDDPDVVKVLKLHLKNAEFAYESLASAETALEHMKNNPPDAVIVDVSLPGMSGTDLIKETESIDTLKEVPVIFLSGQNELDVSSVTRRSKSAFFIKPCDFDALIRKLQEFSG